MDPIPPPDSQSSQPRQSVWGLVLTMVLFGVSLTTNCVQRERQADELRRQGEELRQIKAMMLEQRERSE